MSLMICKTDDFINVDLLIKYRFVRDGYAYLQVNNLFDSKYESFGLIGEDPRSF